MADAIKPALTPEEWAEFGRSPDGWPKLPRYAHADDGPWLMACANHAFPDGHPNKLTRADVKALREVGFGSYHEDCGCGMCYAPENQKLLHSLAARIEALLPPEGA